MVAGEKIHYDEVSWDEELPLPAKLYVVCADQDSKANDNVWTISHHPDKPGWRTDSSYPGYGLPLLLAQELVDCYNRGRGN